MGGGKKGKRVFARGQRGVEKLMETTESPSLYRSGRGRKESKSYSNYIQPTERRRGTRGSPTSLKGKGGGKRRHFSCA